MIIWEEQQEGDRTRKRGVYRVRWRYGERRRGRGGERREERLGGGAKREERTGANKRRELGKDEAGWDGGWGTKRSAQS